MADSQKQISRRSKALRRLIDLILPYKCLIFVSVVCMGFYNIFTAAPAFYAKDIVDALAYGEAPKLERYFLVGLGLIIVFALKGLSFFGQNFYMGVIVQKLVAKLRQKLYDHMLELPLSFYARNQTGDLTARFTNDIQVLRMTMDVAVSGPFRDIPQIFLVLGIMIYRCWQMALLTLVIMPVALFFIERFGKSNKHAVSGRQASFGDMASLLVETVSGIRVVKAFGMENYEQERFRQANRTLYARNMESIKISSYSTPVVEVIGAAAGATIVAYGGYLIIEKVITAGDFASFCLSFFLLNDPLKKLNGFNLKLQEGLAALKRVFSILDTEPDIRDCPQPVALTTFKDKITIDIKQFTYQGYQEPTLTGLFLELNKGEAVALVGSSGAGKTTLINLIPRFYDVTEGSIKIDGYDLRELSTSHLRNLISIVTQETFLFNDTIVNNITYGHPECPEEKMIAAAKAANAHNFIMQLENGYNTQVGEHGVKLSGGQRQRVAIARALLKDSPILILDEATSALDSESEIEVQQAIEHLMKNRTTIVIAHRFSTIQNVKSICVLERGKMIEHGTHEELMASGGRYQQLYEMQFRG
ncbi:MAG: ABC transporter ATP-binding protein [SAR324 cluster bacterium]|nr:ABC transporter ATP-binding protein [SAR324 cluster bacterium]